MWQGWGLINQEIDGFEGEEKIGQGKAKKGKKGIENEVKGPKSSRCGRLKALKWGILKLSLKP